LSAVCLIYLKLAERECS